MNPYDYLTARNRTIEDGDCLVWQLAVTKDGTPIGSPPGGATAMPIRRWAWELETGQKAGKRAVLPYICGNQRCVNPKHARAIPRSQITAYLVKFGLMDTAQVRLRNARWSEQRSMFDRGTRAKMAAMHANGATLAQVAAEFGCSVSVAHSSIRRPGAAPGSSVFHQ